MYVVCCQKKRSQPIGNYSLVRQFIYLFIQYFLVMKIIISNYNDGQVVSYNVVVLKGSILNEDDLEPETVSLGRSLSQESCSSTSSSTDSSRWNISSHVVNPNLTLQAFLKNFDRHEKVELSVKIVRNRFILLVDLCEGINCVYFQDDAGRIVKEFRIKFLPSSNNSYIKPLYIFCVDSLPERIEDEVWLLNQRKIHVGLKLVQTLFAEKLFEWGLSRRTFTLDAFSCEILQIPYTTQQIRELETKRLWDLLAREIRSNSTIWDENCKYVAFMADPWKPQRKDILENSPALAGGGLALMGSDFLQVWPDQIQHVLPKISEETPIEVSNFTFGSFSRNVGSLFGASLGGVAHEIGHIFDLGHTEGGLMGNQYHRVDLCLSPLVSYPKSVVQVSSTDEERQIRPKVCLPNGHIVEDIVSLSFSCATLLFFHRWFRSTPSGFHQNGPILTKNTITSQLGLTVIEIRDLDNGSILRSWTFDRIKVRYEFHLGKSSIPSDQHVVDVVAQDFHGNILKVGVDRNSLPESFTHLRRRNT